jgi:hypothetical protein
MGLSLEDDELTELANTNNSMQWIAHYKDDD